MLFNRKVFEENSATETSEWKKFNRFLFMFLRLCTQEQDGKALRGRVSASIILIYTTLLLVE